MPLARLLLTTISPPYLVLAAATRPLLSLDVHRLSTIAITTARLSLSTISPVLVRFGHAFKCNSSPALALLISAPTTLSFPSSRRPPTARRTDAAIRCLVALGIRNILRRCCKPSFFLRGECSTPGRRPKRCYNARCFSPCG